MRDRIAQLDIHAGSLTDLGSSDSGLKYGMRCMFMDRMNCIPSRRISALRPNLRPRPVALKVTPAAIRLHIMR